MAKAYSNDLRRKILEAYERGSWSLEKLAEQFRVSYGYTKKIRKHQLRTGEMEGPLYRAGRRRRVTPEVEAQLGEWVHQQPDATLAELQQRLENSSGLHVSIGRLWLAMKHLELGLKKNTSRPGTRHTGSSTKASGVAGRGRTVRRGAVDLP